MIFLPSMTGKSLKALKSDRLSPRCARSVNAGAEWGHDSREAPTGHHHAADGFGPLSGLLDTEALPEGESARALCGFERSYASRQGAGARPNDRLA